jgi:uncharacterized protein
VVIVLSCYQIRPALLAHQAGQDRLSLSADLNRTAVEVELGEHGIVFPGGEVLRWTDAERIAGAQTRCFTLEAGRIREIQTFSDVTNWARSLMPTDRAPTMLVSGTPMHRINQIDPYEDTRRKIKSIAPIRGVVLDTATGLGYTAIEASRTAERVVTVEVDPAALEIARYNPWSQELFNNPVIEQVVDDVFDVVDTFDDACFSCIIHDPPMFKMAGHLYSGDFYHALYRVLRDRGRLFHYIGDLKSKSGQGVARGVGRRLQEAGFSRVQRRPNAFGLVAVK